MQNKSKNLKFSFFYIWPPRVSGRFLWVRNPINMISQSFKFEKNIFSGKIEICQEASLAKPFKGGVWGSVCPPRVFQGGSGGAAPPQGIIPRAD